MPQEDYSMDEKIWTNEKDYFIEKNDFNIANKTQLPKGTELTVYDEQAHRSIATCFADPKGNWIEY